jgi:Na+-transporting NADH:ubiquinone oxidoreductase subunit NqrF
VKSKLAWKGERDFINREMLVKHFCDLQGPIFYIAGPPAMAAAMREMLTNAGIDNEDDVRNEKFAGY